MSNSDCSLSLKTVVYEIEKLLQAKFISYIFQFRIECYDSVYPDVKDTTDVAITVTRNLNPPFFEFPRYTQTIPETFGLGQEILTVRATDSDGDAITYAITGDAFGFNNRAQEYYYIGADTGVISLKKPLTEGTHFEDNVRYFILWQRG